MGAPARGTHADSARRKRSPSARSPARPPRDEDPAPVIEATGRRTRGRRGPRTRQIECPVSPGCATRAAESARPRGARPPVSPGGPAPVRGWGRNMWQWLPNAARRAHPRTPVLRGRRVGRAGALHHPPRAHHRARRRGPHRPLPRARPPRRLSHDPPLRLLRPPGPCTTAGNGLASSSATATARPSCRRPRRPPGTRCCRPSAAPTRQPRRPNGARDPRGAKAAEGSAPTGKGSPAWSLNVSAATSQEQEPAPFVERHTPVGQQPGARRPPRGGGSRGPSSGASLRGGGAPAVPRG